MTLVIIVYVAPLLAVFIAFARRKSAVEAVGVAAMMESTQAGLTQPPSLHPVVDTNKCVGCEACINACPEFPSHQVLGLIAGKAKLVSPTDCIGHGVCQTVCPVGAISLVFGTAERGVDIPSVNSDFSTNVDGVYIAGELGGMGLIRNAITQGNQAIGNIVAARNKAPVGGNVDYDVVIIGAGPAGMAATLGAMEAGLKYVTIEQHALGGTVANFPRGKLVMTAPVELSLVGKVQFHETYKEELVGFWYDVSKNTGMQINCDEKLLCVIKNPDHLLVETDRARYTTHTLLLAIGRRGTPRTLGVVGEHLSKVCYAVRDPEQYRGQAVLVVGGGDAALEAACSIAEVPGTRVSLSYRGSAFTRAKKKNRQRLEIAVSSNQMRVYLDSTVEEIAPSEVHLTYSGAKEVVSNDVVVVCAGGLLPDGLLKDIGINLETKYGCA